MQHLSEKGATFIRTLEGFVDHWYLDSAKVPTIGIGFTMRSSAFRLWWVNNRGSEVFAKGARMTRTEADAALIFITDLEYGAAVDNKIGPLPQHVFDATVSPVYNLGPGSLEWKWAAALKRGDIAEAARLLRTTGTTINNGKTKLSGLVARRNEEAELMETADYTIGGRMPAVGPLADGVLRRSERGSEVADLQHQLAARGFYTGKIDGIFGFGTEAAVLAFQRAAEIDADGIAGPRTLAALAEPTPAAPAPAPSPAATKAPQNIRENIPDPSPVAPPSAPATPPVPRRSAPAAPAPDYSDWFFAGVVALIVLAIVTAFVHLW